MEARRWRALLFTLGALASACSAKDATSGSTTATGATTSGTGGANVGTGIIDVPGGSGGDTGGSGIPIPPPTDFTKNDTGMGGWKLGPAITGAGLGDGGVVSANGCGVLLGVVRDFKGKNETDGHPDFETYGYAFVATTALVLPDLGADSKPVYGAH